METQAKASKKDTQDALLKEMKMATSEALLEYQ